MRCPSKYSRLSATTSSGRPIPILLAVVCSAVLLSACDGTIDVSFNEDGSGILTTAVLEVEDFESVSVGEVYELAIRVDPASSVSVSIETDDNLHNNLDVRVEDGVLKLDIGDGIDPSDGLAAIVVVPRLEEVTANGATRVTITGATDSGAGALQLNSSGASRIDAANYRPSSVSVAATGASSQTVWSSGEVSGSASGASSISIKDAGSINITTSGAAQVN